MGYPNFDNHLRDMIEAQRNLQVALGHDHAHMTYEQKIQYVKDNTLAAIAELMEALNECHWKPWATGQSIDEDAMFGELRDVWQFLTNLMLVIEHDPAELADRLRAKLFEKHAINYKRIADGYDGRSTKCNECGRALDDPTTTCTTSSCSTTRLKPIVLKPDPGFEKHCPVCHQSLAPEDTGFRAPELICDGTKTGCRMPDLAD